MSRELHGEIADNLADATLEDRSRSELKGQFSMMPDAPLPQTISSRFNPRHPSLLGAVNLLDQVLPGRMHSTADQETRGSDWSEPGRKRGQG